MPAQICHILLGLGALNLLDETLRPQVNRGAFFLGCQGPDVFYHNQHSRPSGFLYGARMHRWGFGKFCLRLAEEAKSAGWTPSHPGFSYLLGFLSHGLWDRAAHPFIIYFSGWKVPGEPETDSLKRSHAFFERILDVLLYEELEKDNFFHCPWQAEVAGPGDFPGDFWKTMALALWKTYPGAYFWEDAVPRVKNAFADTQGFLQWTDVRGAKGPREALRLDREEPAAQRMALFHPMILPPEDFLNKKNNPWDHPLTGQTRTDSFPQIFEACRVRTAGVFQQFLEFWDAEGSYKGAELEAELGNESLNLPGEDGRSRGPQFSRPWDFAHLMDLQRRWWEMKD